MPSQSRYARPWCIEALPMPLRQKITELAGPCAQKVGPTLRAIRFSRRARCGFDAIRGLAWQRPMPLHYADAFVLTLFSLL